MLKFLFKSSVNSPLFTPIKPAFCNFLAISTFNNTPEEDVKFLFKKDNKFIMPDRLKKINYNRTTKDIKQNIPWFSIHSSTIERTLFKEDTAARTMYKFPYTVPNYSEK